MSLLTWKCEADAGFPEWTDDQTEFVQRSRDDQEGIKMVIVENLHNRIGIRGRQGRVNLLRVPDTSKPPAENQAKYEIQVQAWSLRRSLRLVAKDKESHKAESTFLSRVSS